MSLDSWPQAWRPNYDSELETKMRVIESRFGDGYVQSAPDGLNAAERKFTLTFTAAPTVVAAMDAFLLSKGGAEAFLWTPPNAPEIKVVCRSWRERYANFGQHVLSAEFEKVVV